MNYVYFYLLGQNITYFTLSWGISLLFISFLTSVSFLVSDRYGIYSLGLFLGWFSCLPISESGKHASSLTYTMSVHTHLDIVWHLIEMAVFAGITLFVYADDSSPILWTSLVCVHTIYLIMLKEYHKTFSRLAIPTEGNFFFIYSLMLISTDILMWIISMVITHRVISIYIVLAISLTTFAITYISTIFTYYPNHWLLTAYLDSQKLSFSV